MTWRAGGCGGNGTSRPDESVMRLTSTGGRYSPAAANVAILAVSSIGVTS
jgi:hypothetical protein